MWLLLLGVLGLLTVSGCTPRETPHPDLVSVQEVTPGEGLDNLAPGEGAQTAPTPQAPAAPAAPPSSVAPPLVLTPPPPLDEPGAPTTRPQHGTPRAHPAPTIETAQAAARQYPTADGYFHAMMLYDYIPGTLYQIYTAPERVTDIMLQPGEELTATPATGDSIRWLLGETSSGHGATQQTHVLVKPLRPGLHNNIVLTTTRRVYHLECHSFAKTYMAAVAWRYPHDSLTPLTRHPVTPRDPASASVEPFDPATLHFAYTIVSKDDPPWQPVRVFDTGHKTYIQFPPALAASEAPALFVRATPGGALQLVNYRVHTTDQGTYYIVDRLFEQAELRVGAPKPTVVRLTRQPS